MGLPGPAWLTPKVAKVASTVALVVLTALVWALQDGGGTTTAEDEPAAPTSSATSAPTTAASTTPSEVAPGDVDPESGLPYVALADLPPEATETLGLIDRGGPFPYREDGTTFRNFEGLLPDRPEGYYKEYTVETPGLSHRGARRIVAGAEGELYWTEDHYESFERIWR